MVFTLSNLLIGDGGAKIKDSGTSLASVGGAYEMNYITKTLSDGNTSTVYNHSLGKVPKYITFETQDGNGKARFGVCNISNYSNFHLGVANNLDTTYSTLVGTVGSSAYYQNGKVSNATSTTFTIDWVGGGSVGATTGYVVYKLYA